MARRLNVDQALKGAGPFGSGLAPLTVPQNMPSGGSSYNTLNERQNTFVPSRRARVSV